MKFGVFYELSVPRPWDREVERSVYMNALEQVRLADELGFDQVWCVEHHFLEEYSHSSAPELFLTACAMQTKNIRVGHGIVVCVPQFNHPIRIAERAAVLDILSGGRLEFGTGRSATWTELAGFQANQNSTADLLLVSIMTGPLLLRSLSERRIIPNRPAVVLMFSGAAMLMGIFSVVMTSSRMGIALLPIPVLASL